MKSVVVGFPSAVGAASAGWCYAARFVEGGVASDCADCKVNVADDAGCYDVFCVKVSSGN